MSARSQLVRALPCIACTIEGVSEQCGPTTEHHLNLGGKAGQKRIGDHASIPLGPWHHQGYPPPGMTAVDAAIKYGPSLARQSRQFRAAYGVDEILLARTNELLEALA
jgi:hypothetical protein